MQRTREECASGLPRSWGPRLQHHPKEQGTCYHFVAQLHQGLRQHLAVGHHLSLVKSELRSQSLLQGHSDPWREERMRQEGRMGPGGPGRASWSQRTPLASTQASLSVPPKWYLFLTLQLPG